MLAFSALLAILFEIDREHKQRLREAIKKQVADSRRNYDHGLREATTTAQVLEALVKFSENFKTLNIPADIAEDVQKLCTSVTEYYADLSLAINSKRQAGAFITDQTFLNQRFAPRLFQPGSLGERFHVAETKLLESACQKLSTKLQKRYTDNSLTEDEMNFLTDLYAFMTKLSQTMQEIR